MGGAVSEAEEEIPESNDDGCPGGWYRTAFCYSVYRFLRPHADGVYSASPHLDRCNDRLVLDAVQYFEVEQGRARAHANELIDANRRPT